MIKKAQKVLANSFMLLLVGGWVAEGVVLVLGIKDGLSRNS